MKKYPSYTTLTTTHNLPTNPTNKKTNLYPKYQKTTALSTSDLNINNKNISYNNYVQIPQSQCIKKKQSLINLGIKKYGQNSKKQLYMEKVKTQTNQNRDKDKQDYQSLKTRLHALQYRLVQIKKSYNLRKNKNNHLSIQNGISKITRNINKQNQKNIISLKKQLKIDIKQSTIIEEKNNISRLNVQSPKIDVLAEKSNIMKQNNQGYRFEKQKQKIDVNCLDILSEYVTQYQQKPVAFKHTTSQTNLLRPLIKQKYNDNLKKQNKNTQIYYISSLIRAIEAQKPTTFDQLCTGHLLASYQFLCYVKNNNIQKPIKNIIKSLPPSTKKHTIIFDLDQTLIHCVDAKKNTTADITLPILFPDRNQITVGINIRPYTKQCLKQLSKYFEIMVFTASHANYANAIVDHLDPQKQLISYRFSRQSCYKTQQGFYVKDLRVIDRKLSNILLIDNAAYSYCFQPENGIPIVPYYDNKADLQLKNLIPYLKSFLNQNDVRIKNNQIMKLTQYTKYKGSQDLINQLYK